MKEEGCGQSPPDPYKKHSVKLSPEEATLKNSFFCPGGFYGFVGTCFRFSIMRKQTMKGKLQTVSALTEQPEDNLGLFSFEATHT